MVFRFSCTTLYSLWLHIFLVLLATIKVRPSAELILMTLVLASSLYTWLSLKHVRPMVRDRATHLSGRGRLPKEAGGRAA